jgi:hypothetical protein
MAGVRPRRQQIRQLFRLIDWMMDLPENLDLEEQLYQKLVRIDWEKQMPYVTSVERLALKKGEAKGKAEGKAEALLQILERRFAAKVPPNVDAAIRGTTDLARLEHWLNTVLEANSLEDFRRLGQV